MLIHDATHELLAKLVYLGPDPEVCVAHLERVHSSLAPGLASELRRVPGDGQHLSLGNELLFFDFAPVMKASTGRGLKLKLHLHTLTAPPAGVDLEFLLQGVDVVLFVHTARGTDAGRMLEAAFGAMGGGPPVGISVVDRSRGPAAPSSLVPHAWSVLETDASTGAGVVEALQLATKELLLSFGGEATRSG